MTRAVSYPDDLGSLQLAELRAYYEQPGHNPVTLMRGLFARIRSRPDANVWISIQDEDVLVAAAASLTTRWPDRTARPPLWGVPVAVKDNVDVRGLPTTAGCPDFAYEPSASAELVTRLLEAGALVVGKTNMDQFASGLTGARSAYGICRSPFDADYIGGGSSSGSALAVSLGLASVAIGTDTAGSGRVPAAFTNTVGLKPSRGLISSRGLVPACRSLDCPSVFALSVADAAAVLAVIAGPDAADPWSRPLPVPPAIPAAAPVHPRIGFVDLTDEPVDATVRASYQQAIEALVATGAELVAVDLTPFRDAGDLLYDGPWVAERLTELEPWIAAHPTSLLPVTATVLGAAARKTAVDAFRGFHRLTEINARIAPSWAEVDAVMLPTVPSIPTVADTVADPHQMNTRMGRYTMFGNLLDLAGISVPVAFDAVSGLPSGVSFYAPAGTDGRLAAIAAAFQQTTALPVGATGYHLAPLPQDGASPLPSDEVTLAVVGAHRTGYPLHRQLAALGARAQAVTFTAPVYRLFALPRSPADPVQRPGMIRVSEAGASIEVELHRLSVASLGRFLTLVPAPLGLGLIELDDGSQVIGFLCESAATAAALDITDYKSWPNYLDATNAAGGPTAGRPVPS